MLSRHFTAARAALLAGLAAVLLACGGATPDAQPVPLVAATPEEPVAKAEDYATLDILCEPPTAVLVDGKPAGKTPITGYKVSPGSHDVTFADEETGNRTMSVKLEPGDGRVVKSDRPPVLREKK